GISSLFILSTCNRTEIYGFAEEADQLIQLLCSQTNGNAPTFKKLAYIKEGLKAVEHLFHVGAGLDSQILGDYEIVGQIKQAVKYSRDRRFIGPSMDRLVNAVLQASKVIKNQTELSGGTVSVSFAAIQCIKEKIKNIAGKRILLLGTGKIGRNTCKNLIDYLGTKNITLINRTEARAFELAGALELSYAPYGELQVQAAKADIIIVSTNATQPTLLKEHLAGRGEKLVIDLSIPYNVEASAQELPGVTLVNVDELSKLKDETLAKRRAEVPKARKIITSHIAEFVRWSNMRRNVPLLQALKSKLKEIDSCRLFKDYTSKSASPVVFINTEDKIQQVINGTAVKMRNHNQGGCNYIEAINEFIAPGANRT
ncbi:MAG TPA: glutamyl-tRNA reductase, partial [Chitinophagaceae bacterium]|nr:glutamyl-tRNA reductase [Chitinophagaceae bacterium]